jgi:hypothetical protein
MEKRKIIKLSLIVSVYSLFIFSFTYFGASTISFKSSANQVFSEKTFIGTIDVSGKSPEEAKSALEAKRSEWASSAEIMLSYKGQTFSVAAAQYDFLIEESIASAVNGTQNKVLVNLDKDVIDEMPTIPISLISDLNKESLKKELLLAAENFVQMTEISLENYLPKEERKVISSAVIQISEGNQEIQEFAKLYPSIEIAPETQFSLAAFVQESELNNRPSYTYSQIATAIYQALMPTNFLIAERHIGSQLPDNIQAGFEAKVNFEKKMDLIFFNPNKFSYSMAFKLKATELEVSIIGVPLLYNYSIITSEKQEFKPRTIKQYSPMLEQGQKSVEVEGSPGILVKVYRETYNQNGELLKSELLSEDFYPPVHRVEILPLTPAAQETASTADGDSDTITAPSADESEPAEENASDNIPAEPKGNGNDEQQSSGNQNGTESNADEDDGGLFGKPNEEPK